MTKKQAPKSETQTKTSSIIISNRETGSRRVQLVFHTQGRTHQEHKEECDINNIVKRWQKTGQLPNVRPHQPLYGDFSNGVDYQDSLDRVLEAQDMFDSLPSAVRAAVDNDPAKFLETMATEEGQASLAEAGLKIAESDPTEKGPSGPPGEPSDGRSAGTPSQPPAAENEGSKAGENPPKA